MACILSNNFSKMTAYVCLVVYYVDGKGGQLQRARVCGEMRLIESSRNIVPSFRKTQYD
jgi:hypothetical protein